MFKVKGESIEAEENVEGIAENSDSDVREKGIGKVKGQKEEFHKNDKLYKYLIKTQDQEKVDKVNDDKEVGFKVVEVEDTDVENITEGTLEGFEWIDNNLAERDEELNKIINDEAISYDVEKIDNGSKDDMMIITAGNKWQDKYLDEESSDMKMLNRSKVKTV